MPDLDADTIADAAQQPANASQDGRSVTAVPIPDQIDAAKFQAANKASSNTRPRGIKLVRCIPPGAAE
ncbi:MAG: hypothetical protein U0791_23315 [Gemmataceae bacterium]